MPKKLTATEIMYRTIKESQFQAQVRSIAKVFGWKSYHTRDSRGSDRGFPDLVLVNPSSKGVIYAELKTEIGRLSREQEEWISTLRQAGQAVYVWRPSDVDDVIAALGGSSTRREDNGILNSNASKGATSEEGSLMRDRDEVDRQAAILRSPRE